MRLRQLVKEILGWRFISDALVKVRKNLIQIRAEASRCVRPATGQENKELQRAIQLSYDAGVNAGPALAAADRAESDDVVGRSWRRSAGLILHLRRALLAAWLVDATVCEAYCSAP
jgi:hypothetical protein